VASVFEDGLSHFADACARCEEMVVKDEVSEPQQIKAGCRGTVEEVIQPR
jgi:hypothetical protein